MRAEDTRALGLAVFIGTAGAMHFVRPHFFDAIVPDWMPGTKRQVTLVSGGVELASAVLVATPSTRRVGALACLLTFIGVYPANIQSALDGGSGVASPAPADPDVPVGASRAAGRRQGVGGRMPGRGLRCGAEWRACPSPVVRCQP